MILGVGTDLARIDRIEGALERFGNCVFTEIERKRSERRRERVASYATPCPNSANGPL